MLAKDVKAMAADESLPGELQELAAGLAERHAYPVDFQVIDTRGQLYSQAEANRHGQDYHELLLAGLKD